MGPLHSTYLQVYILFRSAEHFKSVGLSPAEFLISAQVAKALHGRRLNSAKQGASSTAWRRLRTRFAILAMEAV